MARGGLQMGNWWSRDGQEQNLRIIHAQRSIAGVYSSIELPRSAVRSINDFMVSLDTTFATKINIVEPGSFFLVNHFIQVSKHAHAVLQILAKSYQSLCAMKSSIFTMHIFWS